MTEITLRWKRGGDKVAQLVSKLQKDLVKEAGVTTEPMLPPEPGSRTTISFTDDRPVAEARTRVRDVLGSDWGHLVEFEE